MWSFLVLAVGVVCGTAQAADVSSPLDEPEVIAWQDVTTAMQEAEARRAERLAALEQSREGQSARVVVLRWTGTDTDHTNEVLQRNVRTRIARPDAKFYPDVDLYQAGRREPDRTIRPLDQRAEVPSAAIRRINDAINEISAVPWNAMSESDWGLKAHELRDLSRDIWFIDRPELREPLFLLYVQIGRAAENHANPAPPFYEQVANQPVNYYWYLAGAMAHAEPALMSKLTDQSLYESVNYFKGLLDRGQIGLMTLAFSQSGEPWSVTGFASEYEVFINGLEVVIENRDSLFNVPPGRVDIYLKRDDGHSLSDSIDLTRLEDRYYFVRDVARKRMGIDFIDQLMEHPNECSPELEGDILNYLSIYAKLHTDGEIYVAVPEGGNANRTLLWRWDRASGTLQKVLDDTGGFPVRFVALFGVGTVFNSVSVDARGPSASETTPGQIDGGGIDTNLGLTGIPFSVQLRGHYGRFIGIFGMDFTLSATEEGWQDEYQVDGNRVVAGDTTMYKERRLNRQIYGGAGLTLGPDAMLGFGPRGYVKAGMYNVPHLLDVSLHGGMAIEAPFSAKAGRVRPMADVDAFVGMLFPVQQTMFDRPSPHFGLVASVGLTF